ncbi:hypothetical protein AVEN_254688-1 [Araneus ventricosus]|uniref:Reverse transcriptase RNase H-like domain-containing protein n=1 Tax=Araneus ventricosus TaxID=182803 RepID=A0A4Y2V7B9_ARAVE|nr:hypothetical protein AVEN_254688-1 [Araneus ventricosus]
MLARMELVFDKDKRVIDCLSKSRGKPAINCVIRKKLLVIVKSVECFHHYLYGKKFVLLTGHASLMWLFSLKEPEGQVARRNQRLQEYDFRIQHRKESNQGNGDLCQGGSVLIAAMFECGEEMQCYDRWQTCPLKL